MNAVFIDTGGWMACADRNDPAHLACMAAGDATPEAGRTLITTDFVVDETLTLLRFRLGPVAANAWWQQIEGSARLRWDGSRSIVSNEHGTSFSNIATKICRSRIARAVQSCVS